MRLCWLGYYLNLFDPSKFVHADVSRTELRKCCSMITVLVVLVTTLQHEPEEWVRRCIWLISGRTEDMSEQLKWEKSCHSRYTRFLRCWQDLIYLYKTHDLFLNSIKSYLPYNPLFIWNKLGGFMFLETKRILSKAHMQKVKVDGMWGDSLFCHSRCQFQFHLTA